MASYEVELKFPVADLDLIEQRLKSLNATRIARVDQKDTYFGHPVRDFAKTDEAIRVRCIGDLNRVTYKGPKLGGLTKTREEIEVELASGRDAAAGLRAILGHLGFRQVTEVKKTRTTFEIPWQDHTVEASLDEVALVGTFLELELLADENTLEATQASLLALAEELGLSGSEQRSYLEMLLEATSD